MKISVRKDYWVIHPGGVGENLGSSTVFEDELHFLQNRFWYCGKCGVVFFKEILHNPSDFEWEAYRGRCETCPPFPHGWNQVPGSIWGQDQKATSQFPYLVVRRELELALKANERGYI